MLPFKLPAVNQPFPHDIPELDLMPPVVVEDEIVFMNSLIVLFLHKGRHLFGGGGGYL